MVSMFLSVLVASATPSPVEQEGPDPVLVTPGLVGFLVTLAVVLAGIVLANIAARKVRKVQARAGEEDVSPIPIRIDPRMSRQEAEEQLKRKHEREQAERHTHDRAHDQTQNRAEN